MLRGWTLAGKFGQGYGYVLSRQRGSYGGIKEGTRVLNCSGRGMVVWMSVANEPNRERLCSDYCWQVQLNRIS